MKNWLLAFAAFLLLATQAWAAIQVTNTSNAAGGHGHLLLTSQKKPELRLKTMPISEGRYSTAP